MAVAVAGWCLDAWKWRYVVRKIQQVSLWQAILAFFSGAAVSIFTPNRIGDFGGRVLLLHENNRYEGAALTLLGSAAQIIANTTVSSWVLLYFFTYLYPLAPHLHQILAIAILLYTCIVLLLYYNYHHWENRVSKLKFLKSYQKYVTLIQHFSFKQLSYILTLSALRLYVSILQYALIVQALGADITLWKAITAVACIFCVQMLLPSMALVDLGVRGKTALFFFGVLIPTAAFNEVAILAAVWLTWLFNVALPAVIGAFVIARIKLYDET